MSFCCMKGHGCVRYLFFGTTHVYAATPPISFPHSYHSERFAVTSPSQLTLISFPPLLFASFSVHDSRHLFVACPYYVPHQPVLSYHQSPCLSSCLTYCRPVVLSFHLASNTYTITITYIHTHIFVSSTLSELPSPYIPS